MKKQMESVAKKAVKSHEARMHKGVKGMKKGGPTTMDRLKYGRNMAKVMNQKSK